MDDLADTDSEHMSVLVDSCSGGGATNQEPAAAPAGMAHLTGGSEELARTSALTISVGGGQLELHPAVAAAGSRVLRAVLCSCTCDAASRAAALEQAFEGQRLEDVRRFVRLLYTVVGVSPLDAQSCGVDQCGAWGGVLTLAETLEAPTVLQACDCHLARCLGTNDQARQDWHDWLLLADRFALRRTVERCVGPVLVQLLSSRGMPIKHRLGRMGALSQRTSQLLFEATLKVAKSFQRPAQFVPQTSGWHTMGDLFDF